MLVSGEGLLVLIAAVGAFQAWRGGAEKPHLSAWATYVLLICALTFLAGLHVPTPDQT